MPHQRLILRLHQRGRLDQAVPSLLGLSKPHWRASLKPVFCPKHEAVPSSDQGRQRWDKPRFSPPCISPLPADANWPPTVGTAASLSAGHPIGQGAGLSLGSRSDPLSPELNQPARLSKSKLLQYEGGRRRILATKRASGVG
jgi:hypothetical protein